MDTLKIGLCCGTLLNAGLIELIETAGRHGFPTITVRPAAFASALEQGYTEKALRRRLTDAGVQVTMVDALTEGLPGLSTLDISDPKLRALLPSDVFFPPDQDTCLHAAEALEASFINVTHFGRKPVPLEEMTGAIGAVCRRARARGLQVALEFVPGTGLPDLVSADVVARSCGEPNCRITLDPWHLDRSGGSVEDVVRLLPGSLAGVQLCDRIPEQPGDVYVPMSGRIMPGEGQLPLVELVRAALANSPAISIEVELFNDELRRLSSDEIAARVASGTKAWCSTFSGQLSY
ncbi:MAG: sugar phosphate isomerase/epimerase family protein [Rhizomicrobium sp.]